MKIVLIILVYYLVQISEDFTEMHIHLDASKWIGSRFIAWVTSNDNYY